jgi:hypothetical protein
MGMGAVQKCRALLLAMSDNHFWVSDAMTKRYENSKFNRSFLNGEKLVSDKKFSKNSQIIYMYFRVKFKLCIEFAIQVFQFKIF